MEHIVLNHNNIIKRFHKFFYQQVGSYHENYFRENYFRIEAKLMKEVEISLIQLDQLKAAQKNFILLIIGAWQSKSESHLMSLIEQRLGPNPFVIFKLHIDVNSDGEEYCIESLGVKALPSLAIYSHGIAKEVVELTKSADFSVCRNATFLVDEFMNYHNHEARTILQLSLFQPHNWDIQSKSVGTLFLSGDRSSVGKSSMCLAILVSLLKRGIHPSALAYIKPVTQCEAEQPVTQFCDRVGIANRGIGPVVFYKGFTRAYLNGETGSAESLLEEAKAAVEKIGRGKQFVLVDGVGYPSVGSICNISNADVAKKLDVPVLLIGKSGVGDAVDSYNLNSAYFEQKGVRVLGGIFNKLPLEGYYSLEACQESVTSYFQQHKRQHMPYGFVPLIDAKPNAPCDRGNSFAAAAAAEMDVCSPMEPIVTVAGGNTNMMVFTEYENSLSDVFMSHVDLDRLMHDVWIHQVSI